MIIVQVFHMFRNNVLQYDIGSMPKLQMEKCIILRKIEILNVHVKHRKKRVNPATNRSWWDFITLQKHSCFRCWKFWRLTLLSVYICEEQHTFMSLGLRLNATYLKFYLFLKERHNIFGVHQIFKRTVKHRMCNWSFFDECSLDWIGLFRTKYFPCWYHDKSKDDSF